MKEKQEISLYDDIIELPRPVSQRHTPMAISDRAAQFSPFSALAGYAEAVAETGRHTEGRVTLSEDEIAELNRQMVRISKRITERPKVKITFFQPDSRKNGGSVKTVVIVVKKIDMLEKSLIGEENTMIPLTDILEITEIE